MKSLVRGRGLALLLVLLGLGAGAAAASGPRVALQSSVNKLLVTVDAGPDGLLSATSPLITLHGPAGREPRAAELYEIVALGGGRIALRSTLNGRYLRAGIGAGTLLGAASERVGGWETFDLLPLGDGRIALRSTLNGRLVRAGVGGATRLAAVSDAVAGWETFHLIEFPEGSLLRVALPRSIFATAADGAAADRDGDGLLDALEGVLAEGVRPYVVFDSAENARLPDEPITLFQLRPSAIGGATSGGVSIRRLDLKWVFLFRRDGGYGPDSDCSDAHDGDNDDAYFGLESRDGGVSWTLVRAALSSRGGWAGPTGSAFAGADWPREPILQVAGRSHPVIYQSSHKHHLHFTTAGDHDDSRYSSWGCNDDVDGRGARFLVDLDSIPNPYGGRNNVGEIGYHGPPFVDDLAPHFPAHSAWGTGGFFEVGPIRQKWMD